MTIGIAKVRTDRYLMVIFRKIEGYTPSGLGSRSFTVDRLARWLADENVLFFKIFKIRKRAELATFW